MKCRTCKTPKWRGDPCLNFECPKLKRDREKLSPMKGASKPVTAMVKHGFHAEYVYSTTRRVA